MSWPATPSNAQVYFTGIIAPSRNAELLRTNGAGVGVGSPPCTMIVPFMPAWKLQWYGNVPAVGKARVKLPPGAIVPESQMLVSLVAVCDIESLLTQVTLWPAMMVSVAGAKAMSAIDTVFGAAVGVGVAVGPGVGQSVQALP